MGVVDFLYEKESSGSVNHVSSTISSQAKLSPDRLGAYLGCEVDMAMIRCIIAIRNFSLVR